ncbi:hypothetical protein COV49_00835 [Candidatus Falkowbacteria bacterium CG11_big_fil_rev_8_21_14_0_20_39_10]|uniref:GIY-YIG domain-containing protein n=1 Tax=Candidatus Falkowbacteria bacterium CG11_big_fil_rev_8_21_14_0_20_39_10 TaxID=1974570 RepID=A0A2M6K9U8_9BACT|nr:MAG: hypothetical protein COV49_00835 [Candidatus Falkowbacteria bacterium CG11_big_fil_rev_8_21_14_0_20_39_10]
MWMIYIILNKNKDKTYIGSTNNFKKRLLDHNSNKVLSTKGNNPWIPVYIEFYPNEVEARKREKFLKTSTGRRYLRKVIDNIIKTWAHSSAG